MFFRVNRSALVNIRFITSFGDNYVMLENGTKLIMSRWRRAAFEEIYLPFFHGK